MRDCRAKEIPAGIKESHINIAQVRFMNLVPSRSCHVTKKPAQIFKCPNDFPVIAIPKQHGIRV